MRAELLLILAAGCAVTSAPEAELPAPPPVAITLEALGTASPGELLTLQASAPGAPDGVEVRFFFSSNGTGPGPCPAWLHGDCFDIAGPVVERGPVLTSGGTATLTVTVPPTGALAVQAAVRRPHRSWLSEAIDVPLVLGEGDLCDPGADACGTGLSCCYPCGIQGCDFQCTATCEDSGLGWCFDGCPLLP